MTRFLIGLFAVAGCALGVCAEAQTGSAVCWKNTGTGADLASTVEKPVHESNFSFRIPPSANLPAGTLVKITEVRLASVNPHFTTDSLKIGHYDASYIWLNGVRSDGVNGAKEIHRGFFGEHKADLTIASSSNQLDHALAYTFSQSCVLVVGQDYPAAEGNYWETGLALAWYNEKLLYRYGGDVGTCRYRTSTPEDVIRSAACPGFSPVYEVRGTVCQRPGDDPVIWRRGHWLSQLIDGGVLRIEVEGESTVDLPNGLSCMTLELTGEGTLTIRGGRLAVGTRLDVRGTVAASSDGLDLTTAGINLAAGTVFRYTAAQGLHDAVSVTGPGRLVKTGPGELRLVANGGRVPWIVGGDAEINIEEGWFNDDGRNAATTYANATIGLSEDGDFGCLGDQRVSGRLVLRNDSADEKYAFSCMSTNALSRLMGEGTLVQKGASGVFVNIPCGLTGSYEVESSIVFDEPLVQMPKSVSGTGRITFGTVGTEWDVNDGLLTNHLTFDGDLQDFGAHPLQTMELDRNPRNFVRSPHGRAFHLYEVKDRASSSFYGTNLPIDGSDFTIAIRAKTECRKGAILISFGRCYEGGFGLRALDDGQLVFSEWKTNGIHRVSRPTAVERPSDQYHVYALAYRLADRTMTFVADGQVVDTVPCDFTETRGEYQFGLIYRGLRDGASWPASDMYVDDFWVCRKALTPARMRELFEDHPEVFTFQAYVRENPFRFALTVAFVCSLFIFVISRWRRERQVTRAQTLFFSTVSHDIRTPLNAIVGFSELLEEGGVDEADRQSYVKTIRTSGKLLARLVDDILDLSKLQSGKLDLLLEEVDVPQLVREVVSSFDVIRAKKSLLFEAEVDEMPRVVTDPHRLRQILFNLIGNAFKYTAKGKITVRAKRRKGTLALSVQDTGRGIPAADVKRVLQPFVQVADRNHRDGTGLGLTICTRLAKLMGGELTLTSELGVGSTFTVTFPKLEVVEEGVGEGEGEGEGGGGGVGEGEGEGGGGGGGDAAAPRSILIVDDSPVNIAVLKAMLRKAGTTDVLTAENGLRALETLNAHDEIGLVLTDYWMPEMDGAALAREIRKGETGGAHLPLYLITADVDANRNYGEMGFDGVILKPITAEGVADVLRKVGIGGK